MRKSLLGLISLWAILVWACDPCPDCGEALSYDPTVIMIFINQDSASKIEDSITVNTDSIDVLDSLDELIQDKIDSLTDIKNYLDSLIDAGNTDYEDELATIVAEIESYDDASDEISILSDSLSSINSTLDDILDVINSGMLQIQDAIVVDNGSHVDFDDDDSLKKFPFPLLLPDNEGESYETNYQIVITGDTFTIGFSYLTMETIDAERTVKLQAYNIDTLYHTFDSLKIKCTTTECISDETTITVYF